MGVCDVYFTLLFCLFAFLLLSLLRKSKLSVLIWSQLMKTDFCIRTFKEELFLLLGDLDERLDLFI